MKVISCNEITKAVADMCVNACIFPPEDINCALNKAYESEKYSASKSALGDILENINMAKENQLPLCQDTGMCCVFITVGQDLRIVDGYIGDAVNEGVCKGYREGYLRKSIVADPIERINTGDNTPAAIYYDVVAGDSLEITVAPKGAGSENMSRIAMLSPSDGVEGIKTFIIDTVKSADANPCPPIVIGVGIGGNFDRAALNSKKALLRPINRRNASPYLQELESELLSEINKLNIGVMGYGGSNTCLGVNIITEPTHIAMLPVAVNINCHCTRHITKKLV